jgi:hypothetical protein
MKKSIKSIDDIKDDDVYQKRINNKLEQFERENILIDGFQIRIYGKGKCLEFFKEENNPKRMDIDYFFIGDFNDQIFYNKYNPFY